MALLSIVIPVYNTAKYLRECLDSVVGQDISDVEIICVDDGSTDNSLSILEEYMQRDNRVIVVSHPNRGLAATRNAGFEIAKGEYIAFLDSDDKVKKDMYSVMIGRMQESGADVVVCGFEPMSDIKNLSLPNFVSDTAKSPIEFLKSNHDLFESNDLCFTWRYVFRCKVLVDHSVKFLDSLRYFEDFPFNLAAILVSDTIISISIPLYQYRDNNTNSLMHCRYSPYIENCFDISFRERKRLSELYHIDDYMPFTWDMSCYIVKRMIPMLLHNAYSNPEDKDKIASTRRVLSLPSVRRAIKTIGFGNIYPTAKEYVSYLFMKLGFYHLVYRFYNK